MKINSNSNPQVKRLTSVLMQIMSERNIHEAGIAAALGVSRQYLNEVKRERRNLTAGFVYKVADKFDIDPHWILRGERTTNPDLLLLPLVDDLNEWNQSKLATWTETTFSYVLPTICKTPKEGTLFALRLQERDGDKKYKKGDILLFATGLLDSRIFIAETNDGAQLLRRRLSNDIVDFFDNKEASEGKPIAGAISCIWHQI